MFSSVVSCLSLLKYTVNNASEARAVNTAAQNKIELCSLKNTLHSSNITSKYYAWVSLCGAFQISNPVNGSQL